LLRFVNDKDPVPLLPPLDVFSLLDEGPFQHFGPEVVLKDGANYAYFAEFQTERVSVTSFWNTLGNRQAPDHPIANYIQSLQANLSGAR
jgi:triacylglycerol lipase